VKTGFISKKPRIVNSGEAAVTIRHQRVAGPNLVLTLAGESSQIISMFNLLSHLRRVSLAGLIAISLVPFTCQALLSIGLHRYSVPQPTISNDGSGHRTGARTLLRQINSQAQEDSTRDFKQGLYVTAVANAFAFLIFFSLSFFLLVVPTVFSTPPSNRFIPLRI